MTLLLSSVGRGANMPPPPPVATEARTRRARHGSVSDSGKAVVPNDTSRSRSRSARSVSAAPTANGAAGAADGGAVDDTDDDESRVGRPQVVKREVRFFLMLHLAALCGVHRQTHARTRKHAYANMHSSIQIANRNSLEVRVDAVMCMPCVRDQTVASPFLISQRHG